ncbi:MAG: hypothetical protein HY822_25415 [Acidobacteria bacterium]|nr:hypothetical protein [Acidobacteriota bacterium]
MGANTTQALGFTLFLAAFVILAAGMAAGGGAVPILIGLALLAASCAVFYRARPWEHRED